MAPATNGCDRSSWRNAARSDAGAVSHVLELGDRLLHLSAQRRLLAEERVKGAQQERQEAERRLERAIARETKAREDLAGTQQAREQAAEALRAAEAARQVEPSRSKE